MTKLNLLLGSSLCLIMISCGGKNEKSIASNRQINEDIENKTEYDFTTLEDSSSVKGVKEKNHKELFTGVCIEKDQFDSIIKRNEYKNGWLISSVEKERVKDKLYIIKNKRIFENGEIVDGYILSIEKEDEFSYVERKEIYKLNKKVFQYYVFPSDAFKSIGKYSIMFNTGDEKKPDCINIDRDVFEENWHYNGISKEQFYEILDCLKKGLPDFNYWKN